MTKKKKKIYIGWREWLALPELEIPAIKVKVDTGAATSALHAFNIKKVTIGGKPHVSFEIHPLQKNDRLIRKCLAPLIGERHIKNSGGQRENRYVIKTPIVLGKRRWKIEVTLTNRDSMGYRMLLGRQAMKRMVIRPDTSFNCGKMSEKDIAALYESSRAL